MANPVTYNSGSNPTGALKSGTVSMSVAPSLNISGYNWRNGFENNNIWVIYSDTFSQGLTTQGNSVPTIWGTPAFTDAGLLNLINVLPARAGLTAFTVLSDAIAWLYGENKYFLSNQNYPNIVTENLLAFWDAGFSASYPNVGTTFYNLSTTGNGTLTNGPTWTNNNTKSYFNFDGTDDVVVATGVNLQQNFTLEAWINMTTRTNFGIFGQGITNTSQGLHIVYNFGSRGMVYGLYSNDNDYGANWIGDTGKWYHVLFTYNNSNYDKQFYANGVLQTPSSSTENQYTGSGDFRIGNTYSTGSASPANGKIAKARIYNKVLTQDEVLQNYYQGQIVTSNLSYLWDASNLISYYDGSSTTYDMKESGINGTLQNGVTYSSNFGGYWGFDGADDRILLTNSLFSFTIDASINWTVTAWVRTGTSANGLGQGSVMSNSNGGPVYSMMGINAGVMTYWHYNGDWLQSSGTVTVNDYQWHMLTWVNKSNGTMDMYVDGVLDVSNVNSQLSSSNWIDIIGSSWAAPFAGDIASVQVNKGTAMNSGQVSQQYGATRGRFESYQAFANGGTVTTLTQNGINYRVHTFNSSGTLSVTKGGDVEVLMVAGGGGGGSAANSFWETGGGGGAGGLIHNTGFPVTDGTNYTVTIGAGGVGGLNQTASSPSNRSGDGSNTTFSTLTAVGGGGGGGAYYSANIGGSGGGADSYLYQPGANGTQFQGYAGGSGNGQSASLLGAAGGGGGAGGIGQNGQSGSPYKGGDGGIGQSFTFVGNTPTYYAGGGGGKTAINGSGPGGTGGTGGGGNGGAAGGVVLGDSGTANTGGGGGGGLSTSTPTGSGGSGVVMIRYIIP
jgi:hypothetical protein